MSEITIRAIAVDDEIHCLKTLEYELNRICPEVHLIDKIQDPEIALEVLKNAEIDILFLDIHLQTTTGIDLLEKLLPVNFEVIFVTAYDEYAIKAFDLSATHYLLKPIKKENLRLAVQKVIDKKSKPRDEQYAQMLNALKAEISGSHKIGVPVQDGIEFIDPAKIIYIKADSNYSTFHFNDKRKLTVSKTLKIIESDYVSKNFLRVHKSHLINVRELVKFVKNDGGYVIMSDGSRLAVSRSKRQLLNDLVQ